jgi:hypothetical protein
VTVRVPPHPTAITAMQMGSIPPKAMARRSIGRFYALAFKRHF